ncbi:MAG: Gfo/Idh/MocA family oxidoreductase [Candidatus Peribacteraceae bacterium]|jgi:predicted dehydrogenase
MVRIGIVGLGYWGPNLLRNFTAQAGCEVVWACDLAEKNLEKLRRHYPAITFTSTYEDLLKDPKLDLILVATPTSAHFPLAKKALEAGKHVFIEKPMTSTVAEAEELVALAKEKDRLIFVDHTFVFAPAVRKIADLAKDGSLGKLLYFDSVRINLGLIQKDINVLWDLAIHDLSILSTFLDLNDIETVCAHGSKHYGQTEEDVHLHLTTASGFATHVHVSWLSPVKVRRTMLGGSKAMVVYDDTEPSEKIRLYDSGVDHDTTKPDPFFPKYRAGDILIPALPNAETLAIEAKHVLACVEGKEQPVVSGARGLAMVRILEAGTQSLKEGGRVLPLRKSPR